MPMFRQHRRRSIAIRRPAQSRGELALRAALGLAVALTVITLAGHLAHADGPAPAAQPAAANSGSSLIAPSGAREAALWQRLRQVQAAIPADSRRAVPFASVKIGSGPGAMVTLQNNIGGSFRLTEVVYLLDGRELSSERRERVLKRSEQTVFEGRMLPGKHELRVQATIRGHGYGIFSYMKAYRIELQAGKSFTIQPGATSQVRIALKEDRSAPMRARFSLSFKIQSQPSGRATATAARVAPPTNSPVSPL